MPEWNILLTDGLEDEGQTLFRGAAQVDDRNGITAEELSLAIGSYHALIVRGRTKVSAQLLQAASQLRVVGRAGVGVDNIDLAAAKAQGVIVVNTPQATTLAVAELTLALLLALARLIPQADAAMKSGQWLKNQLVGIELNGKVLGLIGMGNIGAAVAQRAAAMGMSVLGYDPYLSAEEISRRGAQPVPLAELFARADFISLHVPLSPETSNILNETGAGADEARRAPDMHCSRWTDR